MKNIITYLILCGAVGLFSCRKEVIAPNKLNSSNAAVTSEDQVPSKILIQNDDDDDDDDNGIVDPNADLEQNKKKKKQN